MKKLLIFVVVMLIIIFSKQINLLIKIFINFPRLIKYRVIDNYRYKKSDDFPYGCTFYVGKQGSGKTISMVHELDRIRKEFPKVKIYTNFGYKYQTYALEDLNDLSNEYFYNGEDGTVFAIDEIQNEFNCFERVSPEILGAITQQRKHKCCILVTSQVFTRVSKSIREQAFTVVECMTLLKRLTIGKYFDGIEYADCVDKSDDTKQKKCPLIKYSCFVQSDEIRKEYNTFDIIKRLARGGNNIYEKIFVNNVDN